MIFPDGRVAPARTLGVDAQSDAGMARLEGEGPWPFVAIEEQDAAPILPGDWVISLGHPAGYLESRPVTARLGRVLRVRPEIGIQSDCALIGGDSGGPVINLAGRVIGIHSRIGPSARTNIHVHLQRFRLQWQRLAAGENWGKPETPLLGVMLQTVRPEEGQDAAEPLGVEVMRVLEGSAAEVAGLRVGDVIERIDGRACRDENELYEAMALQQPGDAMRLSVRRDGKLQVLSATLGVRP